jgi:hypothetical protein
MPEGGSPGATLRTIRKAGIEVFERDETA